MASKAKEIVINIPAPRIEFVMVTIAGDAPLICHRMSEAAIEEMEAKQQGKAPEAKKPRDPEQEYQDSLYFIDRESDPPVYGFPAAGIKKALVTAGGRFAGATMTELRGAITVPGDLLEVRGSEPRRRKDVAVIGRGTRTPRYRMDFMPWEIDVPVKYNAGIISLEQLLNLFQHAGLSVGIGDWRLENRNGQYGQFSIKGAK